MLPRLRRVEKRLGVVLVPQVLVALGPPRLDVPHTAIKNSPLDPRGEFKVSRRIFVTFHALRTGRCGPSERASCTGPSVRPLRINV